MQSLPVVWSLLNLASVLVLSFFFFKDTATTEIYTLSLHDALPISRTRNACSGRPAPGPRSGWPWRARDRKSTRLNSSHVEISYAGFCLNKKKKFAGQAGVELKPPHERVELPQELLR